MTRKVAGRKSSFDFGWPVPLNKCLLTTVEVCVCVYIYIYIHTYTLCTRLPCKIQCYKKSCIILNILSHFLWHILWFWWLFSLTCQSSVHFAVAETGLWVLWSFSACCQWQTRFDYDLKVSLIYYCEHQKPVISQHYIGETQYLFSSCSVTNAAPV